MGNDTGKEMKKTRTSLPPVYDPSGVEDRIYAAWLEADIFRAEAHGGGEPFCIVIPPPNVTGALHMGHALDNTIQDIIIRHRRMQGYAALWLPGTDHAGIATQYVVERLLAEQGLTRRGLGREKFLEHVWAWKDEYEATMINQLQRLGASCDWSRLRFTMDEGLSRAVTEVFVRLYEKGLIYKDAYIVNWCPRCRTTLSDLEVEHAETDGHLYHVRYEVEGGGSITVATTRPETILGDSGIAVHPDDERYRDMVGRHALLPLLGRRLPIVADGWVDREFGTGAVKITPGHDPDDFQLGRRHGLEIIQVMDGDGSMTEQAGPYAGLDRYECRRRLVADLEAAGHMVEIEDHRHAIGHCYRCDTVIEPLVSDQWFVKMGPLAGPAREAVEDGRTGIIPRRFVRVYDHWLDNIRDWPISRQIWWGHRIPAWYCPDGHVTVAAEEPSSCGTCGSGELTRDEDVLDTWFSSALWPFSTLGWPDETDDLKTFYPTSVLVTGYDIIFFWVARMMFMGLEFMGEVPFRHVLFHGMVLDDEGKPMSKSRGNAADPLELIEKYGADALRWSLIAGTGPGQDMRFSDEKIQGARNFANKIWNAARFALMHLSPGSGTGAEADGGQDGGRPAGGGGMPAPAADDLALSDRWILTRLFTVTREAAGHLERYDLAEAARVIYDFTWSEFCDWYLELVKPRLADGGSGAEAARVTLLTVLDSILRLLHPFMPFITEEIWQQLPGTSGLLAAAPWPEPSEDWDFTDDARRMELVRKVIQAARGLRADLHIDPAREVPLVIHADNEEAKNTMIENRNAVRRLARISTLEIFSARGRRPERAAAAVVDGVDVFLPAGGIVDMTATIARFEKELESVGRQIAGLERRLANPGFTEGAPREVVARERARLEEASARRRRLEERLSQLQD